MSHDSNTQAQTQWQQQMPNSADIWNYQYVLIPAIPSARYIFYDSSGKIALEIDFDKRDVVCHGSWFDNGIKFLELLKKCLP